MNQLITFQLNTRLILGEGSLQRTGEQALANGVHHPLIITDQGMVSTGWVASLVQSLLSAGLDAALFADVESDPGIETIVRAAQVYQYENCDSIIALGGGSPMDCAKAAAVLVSNPGELKDYFGIGKVTHLLRFYLPYPQPLGPAAK
jgi:alcohol dehydrogenase